MQRNPSEIAQQSARADLRGPDARILIFPTQAAATGASSKISANMGLQGSTFVFAVPFKLVDGRWFIPRPGDDAWLAGVSGYVTAEGTGLAPVGEAAPPSVPESVPNADLRIVLQGRLLPDGRSYFTAANDYLAGNRDATAGLDDADPAKRAALSAWTQWDMGNYFHRADPLVAALGQMFGLTGADLDALFQSAGARG